MTYRIELGSSMAELGSKSTRGGDELGLDGLLGNFFDSLLHIGVLDLIPKIGNEANNGKNKASKSVVADSVGNILVILLTVLVNVLKGWALDNDVGLRGSSVQEPDRKHLDAGYQGRGNHDVGADAHIASNSDTGVRETLLAEALPGGWGTARLRGMVSVVK